MNERALRFGPYFLLLIYAVFVYFSNLHDWDGTLALAEVDRRAIVLNHEMPFWSYQMCGGVTRIGDPVSFSFSPLMIPIILFGSFLGTKIIFVICAVLSIFFVSRILQTMHQAWFTGQCLPNVTKETVFLATVFSLGNTFLWHSHMGHGPFITFGIAFGLVHFTLKAFFNEFSLKDFAWLSFLTLVFFLSSFYHALVFFLLPAFLIGVVFVCFRIFSRTEKDVSKAFLIRLFKASAAIALGTIIAWPRLHAVIEWFGMFPRTIETQLPETGSSFLLWHHFLPTFDFNYWLPLIGKIRSPEPYGIWEYSAVNANNFCLLFIAYLFLTKQEFHKTIRSVATPFVMGFILVFFFFALGDFGTLSPYHFLNTDIFHSSLRVIGRFNFGISLGFTLILMYFLGSNEKILSRFRKQWIIPSFLFSAILPATFIRSFENRWDNELRSVAAKNKPSMQLMYRVPDVSQREVQDETSHMYEPILSGYVIPNCSHPIQRSRILDKLEGIGPTLAVNHPKEFRLDEWRKSDPAGGQVFLMVDGQATPSCIEGSFVTQNHLNIDPSCGVGTCFAVQMLNPYEPQDPRLFFNNEKNRFCLK